MDRNEKRIIANAVDELLKTSKGKVTLDAVQRLGITAIRRYDIGVDNAGLVQKTQNASFSRVGGFIEVNDHFFEYSQYRDKRASYGLTTRILVHELFHVIDDNGRRFSLSEAFLTALDFEQIGPRVLPRGISDADIIGLAKVDELAEQIARRGDLGAAWDLRRNHTTRFGVPSMNAFSGYQEAFAECGAHMVLDAGVYSYFNTRVVDYFQDRVLSQLQFLK